jgi:hypothetical protein
VCLLVACAAIIDRLSQLEKHDVTVQCTCGLHANARSCGRVDGCAGAVCVRARACACCMALCVLVDRGEARWLWLWCTLAVAVVHPQSAGVPPAALSRK